MESCLAICLDLLGTCILTDEVTQRRSIYLNDRSIPCIFFLGHFRYLPLAGHVRTDQHRLDLLSQDSFRRIPSFTQSAITRRPRVSARAAHDNRERIRALKHLVDISHTNSPKCRQNHLLDS